MYAELNEITDVVSLKFSPEFAPQKVQRMNRTRHSTGRKDVVRCGCCSVKGDAMADVDIGPGSNLGGTRRLPWVRIHGHLLPLGGRLYQYTLPFTFDLSNLGFSWGKGLFNRNSIFLKGL